MIFLLVLGIWIVVSVIVFILPAKPLPEEPESRDDY
jgi:hypothetical protein